MSIVNRVRVLCNSKNLSFAELERQIGIGNGSIRRWDEQSPSSDRVQKVADYFDVSVDYLLGRDEKNTKNLEENYFSIERRAKQLSPEDRARLLQLMDVAFNKAFTEEEDEEFDY